MLKCKYCKSEFFAQNGIDNRYCSEECKELDHNIVNLVCKQCGSIFKTTYTKRYIKTCCEICADFLFNNIISNKSPLKISILCPICNKEHNISDADLLFFDSTYCKDEFLSLFGENVFNNLKRKFKRNFYSCERCGKSLHLQLVRCKSEFKILCPDCSSLLRSEWTNQDIYYSVLKNYTLNEEPFYKKYPFDAGQDIKSLETVTIKPGESYFFKTGVAVQIPFDCVAIIKPRSGLAKKYNISVLGGVIDSNYRGEIQVGLINLGNEECTFHTGDRIAQILIFRVNLKRFKLIKKLDESDRFTSGFGSTGI